ncbi:DUF2524 family protein [Bacillus sp. FJAT-45350]|uniref:DUF2524 family protein n=1 Tax=Bacillus sp. FJAT-45350 TaxID=2011014 RepID=UPI000BB89A4F|nr:DUF2524 family protein [Bacillus sp. FJAT-45350]
MNHYENVNVFLDKVQATVDEALNELMEVKMIRENDVTEYSSLQHELNQLRDEADILMLSMPQHHKKLKEVQAKIDEIQEVMIRGC